MSSLRGVLLRLYHLIALALLNRSSGECGSHLALLEERCRAQELTPE